MAAGDVTIHGSSGRGMRGVRMVWGKVQLDGSNPTPVALSAYMTTCLGGHATLLSTSAPGDDPSWLSVGVSGATLNIYAWKNTGGTDPTLVASTNNTFEVEFLAWGTP